MKYLPIFLLLSLTPAFAQQADPAFMQRAISQLQAQRNSAMDSLAASEAKAAGLSDELEKAKAKIKEFEAKEIKPEDNK
jgi:predicted  nucleic acid-binding Zn-ribbon protein